MLLSGITPILRYQPWRSVDGFFSVGTTVERPVSGDWYAHKSAMSLAKSSRVSVRGGFNDEVLQFIDAKTGRIVVNFFVRANESFVEVMPSGVFRLRLVRGGSWLGWGKLWGRGSQSEIVVRDIVLSKSNGFGIDLRRGVDGNLMTAPEFRRPKSTG